MVGGWMAHTMWIPCSSDWTWHCMGGGQDRGERGRGSPHALRGNKNLCIILQRAQKSAFTITWMPEVVSGWLS